MGWEGDWGVDDGGGVPEEEGAVGVAGGSSVKDAEDGLGVGERERDGVLLREDVDVADGAVCCSRSDITKQ